MTCIREKKGISEDVLSLSIIFGEAAGQERQSGRTPWRGTCHMREEKRFFLEKVYWDYCGFVLLSCRRRVCKTSLVYRLPGNSYWNQSLSTSASAWQKP